MAALCVRVKRGETKLERMVGGIPIILVEGYTYNLPIDHPRDVQSLDGSSTVDVNSENPAGLIWWLDTKATPVDLDLISRDALQGSKARRAQVMARVRARIDSELGKAYSDQEHARASRSARMDPDKHLLAIYNGIVHEDQQIDEDTLPSRDIEAPKGRGVTRSPMEKDEDGEALDLPPNVCVGCAHKFETRKKMLAHKRSVHDARRSKAKNEWKSKMRGQDVEFTEEAV